MNIPVFDLARQMAAIRPEIDEAIGIGTYERIEHEAGLVGERPPGVEAEDRPARPTRSHQSRANVGGIGEHAGTPRLPAQRPA